MSYSKKIHYRDIWYLDDEALRERSPRQRHKRWRLAVPTAIAAAIGIWLGATREPAPEVADPVVQSAVPLERIGVRLGDVPPTPQPAAIPGRLPFEPRVPTTADDKARLNEALAAAYPGTAWQSIVVSPGDNLALIFGRAGLAREDLAAVLDSGKEAQALKRINPGETLRFRAVDGDLLEMVHEIDALKSLRVARADTTQPFKSEIVEVKPEVRTATAVAEIRRSLFLDGQDAGLSDRTIMEFVEIFGWDVDFLQDLHAGDTFGVVFEEIYKDGQKVRNGRILAAEFVNRGRRLRAVWYQNGQGVAGYFSDKGQAMRKAFLRSPVNFTRISSGFNLARRHPILNTIRAHRGVDYAAPMGTPIRAVADGKVVSLGTQNGYGNVIVLQHGDTYSTLYGHMSRFARGLGRGAFVQQGETIGFVGKSGLATGPHLHYEFRISGQHRDPLKVKLPNSLPIDQRYLVDFRDKTGPLVAQLDGLAPRKSGNTMVAAAGRPERERGDTN